MKYLSILLIIIGLILPFFSSDAQTKEKKTNIDEVGERIGHESDNIGKEINNAGSNIDNIVSKIVERWTSPFDD